jgi:hypothetical protein
MKNILKIGFAILITSIALYSCNENESLEPTPKMTQAESLTFFKENMSIFDARVRNFDENQYVKELLLVNFSNKDWDYSNIEFDGTFYNDNGEGNDLVANDLIYTSDMKFEFTEFLPYDKKNSIRSVMNTSIISSEFKHSKKLKLFSINYIKSNSIKNISGKRLPISASVSCDVDSYCCAAYYSNCYCWGIKLSNCSATISLG